MPAREASFTAHTCLFRSTRGNGNEARGGDILSHAQAVAKVVMPAERATPLGGNYAI